MQKENTLPYRQMLQKLNFFLALCLIIPLLTSCESRRTIVNGLEEREANEILVFLATKNIDAVKVKSAEGGGAGAQQVVLWDISVLSNQATEAMHILNQQGLPRRKGQSLLGIFADGGLVPSELQEKIKYQSGLSEQIASVIRKIDGVLDAAVQISFPEEDPLNPGKKKGDITASVYVKHSGVLDDPNSQLVTKIKRLVAGSVTGLSIDDVTLIADRSRFGDIPVGLGEGLSKDKQYVSIWSIVISKESVTRFRAIFFTFTLVILTLLLSFIWMGWKISPLLKKYGGLSALFHLGPIVPEEEKEEEVEEEEEEEEEDEEYDEDEEEDEDEDDTDEKRDVT